MATLSLIEANGTYLSCIPESQVDLPRLPVGLISSSSCICHLMEEGNLIQFTTGLCLLLVMITSFSSPCRLGKQTGCCQCWLTLLFEVPLTLLLLLLLQSWPCISTIGSGEQETKVPNELVKHLYNFSSFYKEGLLYTIYTWR